MAASNTRQCQDQIIAQSVASITVGDEVCIDAGLEELFAKPPCDWLASDIPLSGQ